MKSVVGERGQVTLPKRLRERFGIRPGQQVEFSEAEGAIVVRKATIDDRVSAVYGIIRLPDGKTVDELIDEMRGPAELPPPR